MHKRAGLVRHGAIALALIAALALGCLSASLALSYLGRRSDQTPLFARDQSDHAQLVEAANPSDPDPTRTPTRLELPGVAESAQQAADLVMAYSQTGGEECSSDPADAPSATQPVAHALNGGTAVPRVAQASDPPYTEMTEQAFTTMQSPTRAESQTAAPTSPPRATPTSPQPTATAAPQPSSTPEATSTPRSTAGSESAPTTTPEPTTAEWTWTERLVSVGEDGQYCGEGYLRIRVMALDPSGNQLPGVWIYDRYSNVYQVTGNVGSPYWGPGETMFNYGGDGGGALCISAGEGGPCVTGYTRDMPCFNPPPFEDMWAAGWCQCCGTEAAEDEELCRQMHERGDRCMNWGHYAWRVAYRRSW